MAYASRMFVIVLAIAIGSCVGLEKAPLRSNDHHDLHLEQAGPAPGPYTGPPPTGTTGEEQYVYGTTLRSWNDAREDCLALGRDLVTIKSAEDNAEVFELTGFHIWIGLTDIETEGVYRWASDNSVANFTNWKSDSGEPNNSGGDEHCVHIDAGNGEWNDLPCDRLLAYVCGPVWGHQPTREAGLTSELATAGDSQSGYHLVARSNIAIREVALYAPVNNQYVIAIWHITGSLYTPVFTQVAKTPAFQSSARNWTSVALHEHVYFAEGEEFAIIVTGLNADSALYESTADQAFVSYAFGNYPQYLDHLGVYYTLTRRNPDEWSMSFANNKLAYGLVDFSFAPTA